MYCLSDERTISMTRFTEEERKLVPLALVTHLIVGSSSEFPNFFHLNLRESIARSFLSFDCDDLRGVIRKLGIHVGAETRQQINFSVFLFYSDLQAVSNAVACAGSMFGTAQVIGDVTSEIEHFTFDYDYSAPDKAMPVCVAK